VPIGAIYFLSYCYRQQALYTSSRNFLSLSIFFIYIIYYFILLYCSKSKQAFSLYIYIYISYEHHIYIYLYNTRLCRFVVDVAASFPALAGLVVVIDSIREKHVSCVAALLACFACSLQNVTMKKENAGTTHHTIAYIYI
jgi:hypothetical protein